MAELECMCSAPYCAHEEMRCGKPVAVRHHLLRVIDESGEDYLYPQNFFLPIELPEAVEKALLA